MDFALLLLFYRAHGRFPNEPEEIEPGAVGRVGLTCPQSMVQLE